MKFTTTFSLASLAAVASAGHDFSFAVLRFNGDGFLTEGPMDPIVNPGTEATHYHSIMGGSNFGVSVTGDELMKSDCTTAKIKNDKSNYWVPQLFFQDPSDGTFEKVPLFYMNVYYFFETTDDDIEPFPVGLQMLSGDANTRAPPEAGGNLQLNPDNTTAAINPVQWTCPRTSYDPPSYPVGSDGSTAGIGDSVNQGAGSGFPLYPCDGYASPLRQDIHFPSCYNPDKDLTDYKNNMVFPSTGSDGKQNCPEGYKHVPHLFYEVYWQTTEFDTRWTADGKTQPFVLSNGDATGFSSHGDFIAGWDEDTLSTIINTCNAGTLGMDTCPDIPGGLNTDNSCTIAPAMGKLLKASQTMTELPVGCKVTGWGKGGVTGGSVSSGSGSSSDSGSDAESSESVTISDSPTSTYEAESYPSAASADDNKDATSTAEAAAGTAGGAFIEQSASTVADAPEVTNAPVMESAGGDEYMSTVWDIVTVTATTTIVSEETPAAKLRRRVPRSSHGHHARHLHGGFAGRR
ncbi:hypothetical protein F5Y15DRAFT_108126 [Xylariaceae sp. FL0016]|nr:hypothetical protein F5Y15DRAFT_108126 [Xylariaceae sp. FL0016]